MDGLVNDNGLQGISLQTSPIVSDVEGLFGVSFSKDINAILNVTNELGGLVRGANVAVSWSAGGTAATAGGSSILDFDPTILYDDKYPENTLLTFVASGGPYKDLTVTATIPLGEFRRIDLVLQFKEKFVRITKKRYL